MCSQQNLCRVVNLRLSSLSIFFSFQHSDKITRLIFLEGRCALSSPKLEETHQVITTEKTPQIPPHPHPHHRNQRCYESVFIWPCIWSTNQHFSEKSWNGTRPLIPTKGAQLTNRDWYEVEVTKSNMESLFGNSVNLYALYWHWIDKKTVEIGDPLSSVSRGVFFMDT